MIGGDYQISLVHGLGPIVGTRHHDVKLLSKRSCRSCEEVTPKVPVKISEGKVPGARPRRLFLVSFDWRGLTTHHLIKINGPGYYQDTYLTDIFSFAP